MSKGMDMKQSTSAMPDMSMDSPTPRGCKPPMMFRPGYNASDLPPDTYTNTLSPLLTIPATRTQGWLALNLVNSGSFSISRISLDAHAMLAYAADGVYVQMEEVRFWRLRLDSSIQLWFDWARSQVIIFSDSRHTRMEIA